MTQRLISCAFLLIIGSLTIGCETAKALAKREIDCDYGHRAGGRRSETVHGDRNIAGWLNSGCDE